MPATLLAFLTLASALPNTAVALPYLAFPVFLLLYFLPTVVARRRAIKNDGGVILLNLFLGWTLIGWLVALAWAAAGVPVSRHA